MASGSSRCRVHVASIIVTFLCASVTVSNGYRLLDYPSFSEVHVLRTTRTALSGANYPSGDAASARPTKRIEFSVRGRHLYKGLPVRVVTSAGARDSSCEDDNEAHRYNVTQLHVDPSGERAVFLLYLPLKMSTQSIYFCLPRARNNDAHVVQTNDDDDNALPASRKASFESEIIRPVIHDLRWYHQGDNIAIKTDYWMDHDLGTDLDYQYKKVSRDRRQVVPVNINQMRVLGLRVDIAPKDPSHDADGIPSLLVGYEYVLRLFGVGFTEDLKVTFTQQKSDFGASCQMPVTGIFSVIPNSLSIKGETVQVRIKVPKVETSEPLYICVKDSKSTGPQFVLNSQPFVHQGNTPWLGFNSHERFVPLWAAILIICICLCFSALFSGLNLGLMSLDRTELKILCNTGTEQERRYAHKIQPVRNHGNFLLCSILLGNVLVNSTFTILLDDLTSGVVAVVCATLAIVMFGEITPQAICSRHGLAVGAKTIVITKMVMIITFPLSYPISRVLDVLLGEEIGSVYTRERLKELVKVTTGENDLDKDEVNIISGALELHKKTVADVMTKIEDAFMLSYDAILDFETVSEIMKSGYSRIPVYENDRKNIVTTLYIKDLAFVDPDDNTPLKTLCQFYQNPCNFVFEDVTLDIMFKDFKEGNKGHMAFVNRVNTEGEGDPFYETIGLITLEDVIEELIQAEIMDETDVFTDNRTKRKRNADRTKQDFTVFAERRGESNRIRISPQLTLATFQYLATSVDMFKPPNISETILRRLLKQDIYHHIKKNKDWRNDPLTIIYQQGVSVDYFVLILEGRVEVTVGEENLTFESGPFTYFGTQALMQNISVAESPTTLGSLQSLNMDRLIRHTFQPDYTVRACSEVLYLKLKRNLYFAAKRASLMEMSQKDPIPNGDAFDDEVEKFIEDDTYEAELHYSAHSVPSDEDEQLLHSLEDDDSIGRQSPEPKRGHKSSPPQSDRGTKPSSQQDQPSKSPSQTTSPRTSTGRSQQSPTNNAAPGGSGSVRTFGSRDLNGSVKHTPTSPNDNSAVNDKEEEESLLSKKS